MERSLRRINLNVVFPERFYLPLTLSLFRREKVITQKCDKCHWKSLKPSMPWKWLDIVFLLTIWQTCATDCCPIAYFIFSRKKIGVYIEFASQNIDVIFYLILYLSSEMSHLCHMETLCMIKELSEGIHMRREHCQL